MLHHITQQKAPSSIRVEDHIIDAFASFRQWDPMDAGAPRKELHVVTKKKNWDVCYVCSQEFVHPQFQWFQWLFLMLKTWCSFLWCCCVMPCKMWPTIVFQNYVVLCRSEICTTSASLDLDLFFMGILRSWKDLSQTAEQLPGTESFPIWPGSHVRNFRMRKKKMILNLFHWKNP